jgi:hypothetical protein
MCWTSAVGSQCLHLKYHFPSHWSCWVRFQHGHVQFIEVAAGQAFGIGKANLTEAMKFYEGTYGMRLSLTDALRFFSPSALVRLVPSIYGGGNVRWNQQYLDFRPQLNVSVRDRFEETLWYQPLIFGNTLFGRAKCLQKHLNTSSSSRWKDSKTCMYLSLRRKMSCWWYKR